LPIRFAVLSPPVSACFPDLESKNFNYLVLILILPRAGASSGGTPANPSAADARGGDSTTKARAFAADLLQVQQSEIFDSIHDCG
jgi:hypothetical protein